jgi:putative SOS response-associated peptidase YedK
MDVPLCRNSKHEASVPRCDEIPRCLIPADGFYEWKRDWKSKEPFCFELNQGQLFTFAGLWDRWKDPSGQWIKSCSILTTTPNAATAPVHDGMPVIPDPDAYELWLDPGMKDVAVASYLLKPFDARLMRCYPVSSRINSVINDDAECSARVELAEAQDGLFCSATVGLEYGCGLDKSLTSYLEAAGLLLFI